MYKYGFGYPPTINQLGTLSNQSLDATLTSTGTGVGVSTLRLEVSETQTLTITSGTARFYTDAAGTLGESTTWMIAVGAMRTIYLKAPSASSIVNIPSPDKVIKVGNPTVTTGWVSSTNAASLSIDVSKLINCTQYYIAGSATLVGAFTNNVTALRIDSNLAAYAAMSAMPALLTYVTFDSNLINYTGLDFSGTGNITVFDLKNYRVAKMSSVDMITLLTSLTNRIGAMPASIRIGDYADYASPPAGVTAAVDALKAAKAITTVTLAV